MTDTDGREERLRERAYALWEAEGRPEGREVEHWSMAERELTEAEARPATTLKGASSAEGKPPARSPTARRRRGGDAKTGSVLG